MRKKFDDRLFHSAVHTIAMQRAKQKVRDQIRARGQKIAEFSAREIAEQAETYLAEHRDALNAKAILDVCEFPEFARHHAELASLKLFAMIVETEHSLAKAATITGQTSND